MLTRLYRILVFAACFPVMCLGLVAWVFLAPPSLLFYYLFTGKDAMDDFIEWAMDRIFGLPFKILGDE